MGYPFLHLMPSVLNHDIFIERVNEIFTVHADSLSIDLELIECRRLTPHSSGKETREPFALTLRGPARPVLPQRTYSLRNERMGELQIFLVPIGPDEKGMRYEAVFN